MRRPWSRLAPYPKAVPATTLVVISEGAPLLVREACRHARANGEDKVYCLYVCAPRRFRPDQERRALEEARRAAREEGIRLLPMAHIPGDATEAVIQAAEQSGARVILMNGVERQSAIERLLGRRTLRRIRRRLTPERSVLFYD